MKITFPNYNFSGLNNNNKKKTHQNENKIHSKTNKAANLDFKEPNY